MVTTRDFAPGDEPAFLRLNEEWISRYFVIEPKDEASIRDPHKYILEPGGRIFFACLEGTGEPVGCCALMAMPKPGEYEVAKMAVTASSQGLGVGRRLLAHTIGEAEKMGAKRLYLETNHILSPAIHLYESLGFRHLRQEEITPSPYARADVYMERLT